MILPPRAEYDLADAGLLPPPPAGWRALPKMAPGLKKALFGNEGRASFPTSGHALLSLLDARSTGLAAVLTALGSSPELLRLVVTEQLS